MRRLLLALLVIPACTGAEPTDGIDDVGLSDGKADGANPTECESRELLATLNLTRDAVGLINDGVNARAANSLVAYRKGADGAFDTNDDETFESLDEVDEVAYVGRTTFNQLVDLVADRCVEAPEADIYAEARDVNKEKISFPEGTVAPTDYEYPDGGDFELSGTEFWQKWSGGLNPTYDFGEGTDKGRLCQQAAAVRFTEMMKDPPRELVQLNADTNWDGSFYNWNDDYSGPGAYGNASGARLWAWRTGLIKWISQTAKDGSCYLPTREMVIRAATNCLSTGASGSGEIEGCRS